MLWGSYAQKKGHHINRDRHLVLQSAHPSPLSAHRGFLGNGHFSRTNQWLEEHCKSPIDWQLPTL
jgi:uracil-DNA glycosylase